MCVRFCVCVCVYVRVCVRAQVCTPRGCVQHSTFLPAHALQTTHNCAYTFPLISIPAYGRSNTVEFPLVFHCFFPVHDQERAKDSDGTQAMVQVPHVLRSGVLVRSAQALLRRQGVFVMCFCFFNLYSVVLAMLNV